MLELGNPMLSSTVAISPWGKILMQELLHLGAKAGRFFDPETSSAAQVQPDEAGVNRREEILAQKEHPAQREQAERKKTAGEKPAMLDRGFQQLVVAAAEFIEAPFESALKASHETSSARPPCARARA